MPRLIGSITAVSSRHCERTLQHYGLLRYARNDTEIATQHSTVIPAHAGIQYAAAYRFNHRRLWNTWSSAFAEDDDRVWVRDLAT